MVRYNETYSYNQTNADKYPTTSNETMLTVNMGGLDVWNQMKSKPKFYKAWQAMVQANEVMQNSGYLDRLYAYNALEFFFND